MSGLVAGAMLGGLGQGIAQFGATLAGLERERERLEEARALKREELMMRFADRAAERQARNDQKDEDNAARLTSTMAAAAGQKAQAEATHGTQPTEDQIVRRLMLENGWTREEATRAYRADPVSFQVGPSLEEPGAEVVDREASKKRGERVLKAEADQLMYNRPGYADQYSKGASTMRDMRLGDGIINGQMNAGKVADATLSTKTGERFTMNDGSVLKKATGETASTEVGAAEADKARAEASSGGTAGSRTIREQINLVDAQRKSADTRIRELLDMQKAEAASLYSPEDKRKVTEKYNALIKTEQQRRTQLDALFERLNANLLGDAGKGSSGGAARPPANSAGVSSVWENYQRMKNGGK